MGYVWGFVWQNVVTVSEYIKYIAGVNIWQLLSPECSKCWKVRKGWALPCISFSNGNGDCGRHRR